MGKPPLAVLDRQFCASVAASNNRHDARSRDARMRTQGGNGASATLSPYERFVQDDDKWRRKGHSSGPRGARTLARATLRDAGDDAAGACRRRTPVDPEPP